MRQAVRQAESTLTAADSVATDLAWLLRGRLRRVNRADHLRALKRELRDFNMRTGRWWG
jgi:hypothetical protein